MSAAVASMRMRMIVLLVRMRVLARVGTRARMAVLVRMHAMEFYPESRRGAYF